MRVSCLIAFGAAMALALSASPAIAEESEPSITLQVAPQPAEHAIDPSSPPTEAPAAETSAAAPVPTGPHPVVELIKTKLADPALRKDANPEDLAALEAFYAERSGGPLWMTEMGFSTKGQEVLHEIAQADDWGLDKTAFDLPPSGVLPTTPEAQADAEIKLDLALLKYARHARGGRYVPSEISDLFDQAPQLRDPKIVLAEIAVAEKPGAYVQSLHPQHEGFAHLRQALLTLREETGDAPETKSDAKEETKPGTKEEPKPEAKEKGKPEDKEVARKRIVLNMERWRWLPEDLGEIYVWLNTPEYMLYLIKDGKTIFTDKTLVGTISNATPVFSADMGSVVFNPEWIAPRSVLNNALLPPLRKKNYSFLKKHRFSVRYGGKPVNVARVKWNSQNIHNYTFIQRPGPGNNLGKIKFLYPNQHDVYMHDTIPVRKKVFQKSARSIGYGCVRMEKPLAFAEILLAEDQEFPKSKVKELWDKSVNEPVEIKSTIPVHTTYFTAVADGQGKVETFVDIYGLDRKMAETMFGSVDGFPPPPPEVKERRARGGPPTSSRAASGGGVTETLGSLFD